MKIHTLLLLTQIHTLLLLTPLAYCAPAAAAASLPIGALETSLEKLLVEKAESSIKPLIASESLGSESLGSSKALLKSSKGVSNVASSLDHEVAIKTWAENSHVINEFKSIEESIINHFDSIPRVDKDDQVKEILKRIDPNLLSSVPAGTATIADTDAHLVDSPFTVRFGKHARFAEDEILEGIDESDKAIAKTQKLPTKSYNPFFNPYKAFGDWTEDKVAAKVANDLLSKKFGWVPVQWKQKVRNILFKDIKAVLNALCAAKVSKYDRVKEWAEWSQVKISHFDKAHSPFVVNMLINTICSSKR